MPDNNDDKYLVPGLERGLKVLELFDENHNRLGLNDISKALGINRSSAFRLVWTLEHCGYLLRDEDKNYSLSFKALQLGAKTISNLTIIDLAAPVMRTLRDSTRTAVHLCTLSQTSIVYIYSLQSPGPFLSNIRVGTHWPAHATVIGQLLLGGLSDDEIRQRYHGVDELKSYSPATPKNVDELIKKVHKARESEYLLSWKNFQPNMVASASPLRHPETHEVPYVLSTSYPASGLHKEEFIKRVIPLQIDAARKITERYLLSINGSEQ